MIPDKITKDQIKKIKTLVSLMAMDDDLYRDILQQSFNVTTCTALTSAQTDQLLASLENRAEELGLWKRYNNKSKYTEFDKRSNMATAKQLRMIEAMWKDVSYNTNDQDRKQGLRKFLQKKCHVSDLRFLTKTSVIKLVAILKDMQSRKVKSM